VLIVGNHSGGNVTPDTMVFTLAFSGHFGVERRMHPLVHNLVLAMPLPYRLAKYGCVAASHDNARLALERGGHLHIGLEDYPGDRGQSNEELVAEAVALAAEVGRPIASCAEAAEILNLPERASPEHERVEAT
jgi:uncharacterized protein (DUF849 family)